MDYVRMVHLYDKESGAYLGSVAEAQFRFLQDYLEEESEDDSDFYIDTATIEWLQQQDAYADLLEILARGLARRDEMEIYWRHE